MLLQVRPQKLIYVCQEKHLTHAKGFGIKCGGKLMELF